MNQPEQHEKIRQLLSLKRHETPGDEYFTKFTRDLERRLSHAIPRRTAVQRLGDWWAAFQENLLPLPGAGAFAAVALTLFGAGIYHAALNEVKNDPSALAAVSSAPEAPRLPRPARADFALRPGGGAFQPVGFHLGGGVPSVSTASAPVSIRLELPPELAGALGSPSQQWLLVPAPSSSPAAAAISSGDRRETPAALNFTLPSHISEVPPSTTYEGSTSDF